ncbi:MAG: zinc ribbon domain-containing protein [Candidatus Marinimicrobia bacterium]|nr:zinc ribbon domain-containing protein [Candidatus Neomarinimicrobiota bacterium]
MPIYDYNCRQCDQVFSALVTSSSTPAGEITCPDCGHSDAEKLLSMRTAVMTGGSSGASAAASCGAGDSGFY